MTATLSASGVSKMFGLVCALNEIDVHLSGGVLGLLGPNGSGKSTLLKLFSGQLTPDTGEVRVLGRDPFREPAVLRHLGLCPEQDRFYEELSGYDFVTALTRLHGLSSPEAKRATEAALERVGMSADGHKPLRAMSRGMRQRIKIAQAIAHDPAIVLLDEPLNGADPIARADLIRLVQTLGDEGRCVLVSSHVLHEVEAMTHKVLLIRHGRLRAQGDFLALRELIADRPYRIRVGVEDARGFATALIALPHTCGVEVLTPVLLELKTTQLDLACADVARLCADLRTTVTQLTSPDADLESLYRYLMRDV